MDISVRRPCQHCNESSEHAIGEMRSLSEVRESRGAIVVDGKMVDVPVVERAKSVLAREAVIAARERR